MAVILFADDSSTKCNSSLIPFSMLSLAVKNCQFLYMLRCEYLKTTRCFSNSILIDHRDINYYMILAKFAIGCSSNGEYPPPSIYRWNLHQLGI